MAVGGPLAHEVTASCHIEVAEGVGADTQGARLLRALQLKRVHGGPRGADVEAAANEPSLGDRVFHDDVAVTGGENPGRRMGKHRERGRAKSTPRTGRVAVHSGEGSATDAFADGPGKDVVG